MQDQGAGRAMTSRQALGENQFLAFLLVSHVADDLWCSFVTDTF